MNLENRRWRVLATGALLTITLAWGSSFVLMKDAITRQPVPDFLFTRFALASIIMMAARPGSLRHLRGTLLRRGSGIGLFLGAGFITQTIGLALSTAAITGFLTGLYVILTPLLGWLLIRQRLHGRVLIGAVLALVALGVLSLTDFGIGAGAIWVIVSAVFFALHIVALGRWSPGADAYALTVIQLIAVTIMTGVWTFVDGNGYIAPPDSGVWWSIVITAVFATAVGFFLQTWAQGHMEPARVAVLLTTEVLWAGIISVAVGQEPLTVRLIIGGAVMFTAMLVIEWPTQSGPGHPIVHLE